MSDWQAWVGRRETRQDVLTPGLIARHRATLNRPGGDAALPGIHWCLCLPDAPSADLGTDGHPRRDLTNSFMPPIPLPRRMWASSKVTFVRPIAAGAMIERQSSITSVSEKTGGSGALAFVDLLHETRADGSLAVSETQTIVYREAFVRPAMATAADATPPPSPEPHKVDAWPVQHSLTPDEAMLFRFSALTFNAHRIHYDLPYAQREEGYAGLVVHGPLTASLLLNFATDQFGPLAQFSFRGLAPAFAGDAMTLVARRAGGAIALGALGPGGALAVKAEAQIA